uniref:Uncharacterized protein n=1 Tax=Helianthus annuus TaxID=4232 RepID=A0A251SPG3_HELAN
MPKRTKANREGPIQPNQIDVHSRFYDSSKSNQTLYPNTYANQGYKLTQGFNCIFRLLYIV